MEQTFGEGGQVAFQGQNQRIDSLHAVETMSNAPASIHKQGQARRHQTSPQKMRLGRAAGRYQEGGNSNGGVIAHLAMAAQRHQSASFKGKGGYSSSRVRVRL